MSATGKPRAAAARFRRSPHIVVYWQGGQLCLHEYASSAQLVATPLALGVLDYFSTWRTARGLARHLRIADLDLLQRLVGSLVDQGVLHSSAAPVPPAAARLDAWGSWSLSAGFFHQATRDVAYAAPAELEPRLHRRARRRPPPAALKTVDGPRTRLPRPTCEGELARVLMARRTWRRFGTGSLTQVDLATLLWLTWGVQHWVDLADYGPTPLTTSPSPGARHSIEAHVLVRRVHGLRRGFYHYAAAEHALVRLDTDGPRRVSDYLPTQWWYDQAAVVVFLTAVFARAQWRYPNPRTYRSLLAEVGHQAQSFCLLATERGLAPFCTMAVADSRVEEAMGVDGITEAVLYAVGVGRRPTDASWAPWPATTRTPPRRPVDPAALAGQPRLAPPGRRR